MLAKAPSPYPRATLLVSGNRHQQSVFGIAIVFLSRLRIWASATSGRFAKQKGCAPINRFFPYSIFEDLSRFRFSFLVFLRPNFLMLCRSKNCLVRFDFDFYRSNLEYFIFHFLICSKSSSLHPLILGLLSARVGGITNVPYKRSLTSRQRGPLLLRLAASARWRRSIVGCPACTRSVYIFLWGRRRNRLEGSVSGKSA